MKISNETKIGILVVVVLALLIGLTLKTGDFNFSKEGYTVAIQLTDIEGITKNSPVMFNGLEVGYVKSIDVMADKVGTKMVLNAWIGNDMKLRDGVKANIKSMGFMGEKYVALYSGEPGGDILLPGAVIEGKEAANIDKLLADGQIIAEQLKEASTNINERLAVNKERIDQIVVKVDTTMDNFVSISDNLDERLDVNKDNFDHMISNLKDASINLDELTYDLKLNPWKLLYRPKGQR